MEGVDSGDSIPVNRHRDGVEKSKKKRMRSIGMGQVSPIQLLVNEDVLPENTWTERQRRGRTLAFEYTGEILTDGR